MKRQYELYLKDILTAIERIQDYVEHKDFDEFSQSQIIIDAVMRNLEVIGEAATQVPAEIKNAHKEIPWRDIQDFRIVVAHKYWKINTERVWDIIENKLDTLKEQIEMIFKE